MLWTKKQPEEEIQFQPSTVETEVKCKVISDTTPYTLLNIVTYNDSYFQYMFLDEDLKIINCPDIFGKFMEYRVSDYYDKGIYFDLEDNAEPFVIFKTIKEEWQKDRVSSKKYITLHLPANTVIKVIPVGGSETVVKENAIPNNNNSFLAGAVGLTTGIVIGSII
jgi:hypothetical protein